LHVETFDNPTWNDRTPHLGRRFARAAFVDLLVLLVLVSAGEGAVRLLLPDYNRFRFTDTLTGGHPKLTNASGLRDREFPDQPPLGQTRILCLGNSTTFGTGVAFGQTYPKQLERLLNEEYGDGRYFVINAGGEGGSLGLAMTFLEEKGLQLDPSIVILCYSPSMMAIGTSTKSGESETNGTGRSLASSVLNTFKDLRRAALKLHSFLYRSYLYVAWDTNVRHRLYALGVLRDRLDKPRGAIFAYAFDDPGVRLEAVEQSYETLADNLHQLKQRLDKQQVHLLVLGIPSRFELTSDPIDNERNFELSKIRIQPITRMAQYCRRLGVPFVDLRPRLKAQRQAMKTGTRAWDDLYIPFDYTHLNATGLYMAAQELASQLDKLGWLEE
jgi:lysophospholipase L1-like esterase